MIQQNDDNNDDAATDNNDNNLPMPIVPDQVFNVCQNKISYVEMGTSDIIKSPNYPGVYPKKLNCSWLISTVRQDERVRLVFLSLNIDSRGDRLVLYDGDQISNSSKMTGPLDIIQVDNDTPLAPAGMKRPYFSSGRQLTVNMMTDEKYETSGFQLTATAVKKGRN